MSQRRHVPGNCPVCGEALVVTRLTCTSCGSALEGTFQPGEIGAPASAGAERFGRLARLDAAQLQFVEVFLRCRGVIKNVEDMLGISYPTVKARLANVLETLGFESDDERPVDREMRREILADLSSGRISVEEAHRRLRAQETQDSAEDDA
ncbi:MAG TPA: DUF2089 domain-containing protein [Ktedonobacterales bacterium]|jgi:hypothetical protein|nr:DUF2089 domain-containing protein [Ktedonobacterales bacterium]